MHLQKYSFLGGAMVDNNHFFLIQDQVTKVSWYIILHIFVCCTFIDINHQSELIKFKTDNAMHLQKYFISVGAMVDKNHIFSDPGQSNQSELFSKTLQIFVCSTFIDSILQSEF